MPQSAGEPPVLPDATPELVKWADSQEAVRAVLLTSTRAIPGAPVDILSDYDVILVLRDIQPFVSDHSWLAAFGEVLVAYWDPIHVDPQFGIAHCSNVIQYRDGLKIDFTLWPVTLLQRISAAPSLPAELDAGYRVLIDKDQITMGMRAPSGMAYVPKPPTLQAYQLMINDFLSDAPYMAKCLWRNELMPAKWCLDYDMKQVYLRPMLEWLVEIDHDWLIPVGLLGKGLKKYLPRYIWTALEQTYTGADIKNNWVALNHTLELFCNVSRQVGSALGYSYPEELHKNVVDFVENIRNL